MFSNSVIYLSYAVELATLTREEVGSTTKTVIKVLPSDRVDELIAKYQAMVEAKKREEKEKEKQREAAKMDTSSSSTK